MKTHLILVQSGGLDPLDTLGPASRSGRIFLRLQRSLREGDGIALKFRDPSGKPFLLDGIIVSCSPIRADLFHLQVDVSQSLAALLLQNEIAGDPPKKIPAARMKKQSSGRRKIAGKSPPENRAPVSEQRLETIEIEDIREIEEISDIDIIEIGTGPATPLKHEDGVVLFDPSPDDFIDFAGGPGSALGLEEMRRIVSQEEIAIATALPQEKPVTAPDVIEKKALTDEERRKAEPVGKFLMNLTKAMLRSGYYDPGHPSAGAAKQGLYEEFIRNAGEQNEIVFTREKTRKTLDIYITGVLDEQVSVRMLVGQGVAELFLPKLSDYYDRKGLLSFVIRKEITPDHFDGFIDIMSDPTVDNDADKAGAVLTRALVENGITEISTVFISDRIELGLDLPWRVEMAIQRLAKDFKIMPMFRGVSTDVLKQLKMQTIADILRPLKHPRYYSEFLVNCHVIAREVKDVPADEIENMIVDAFPLDLLIPTSHFTFTELRRLEQRQSVQSAAAEIDSRLVSIRRILKMVSRRVAVERPTGATRFLADLYRTAILAFEDLPPEAQYLVNSRRLADDIETNFEKYERSLKHPKTPDDAVVYLKCFRRAAPVLIEEHRFDALIKMAELIHNAAGNAVMQSDAVIHELSNVENSLKMAADADAPDDGSEPSEPFFAFVFGDSVDMLIDAFSETDMGEHKRLGHFLAGIGILGVRVMSQVLAESKIKDIRKAAVESMVRMGQLSRQWALRVLANRKHPWYLHRNAMMILKFVSRQPEDFEAARVFCVNENTRLREEAIGLVIGLRPTDAESLIIGFLDDPDPRVRWRALRALSDISPISDHAMNDILGIINAPMIRMKQESVEQKKKIANLISAVNGMSELSQISNIETAILTLIENIAEQEKGGMLTFFKKGAMSDEDVGVVKAALPLLARIGTTATETSLRRLQRVFPQISDGIASVLTKIRERQEH